MTEASELIQSPFGRVWPARQSQPEVAPARHFNNVCSLSLSLSPFLYYYLFSFFAIHSKLLFQFSSRQTLIGFLFLFLPPFLLLSLSLHSLCGLFFLLFNQFFILLSLFPFSVTVICRFIVFSLNFLYLFLSIFYIPLSIALFFI